jgi:hypothetical protein
MATLVEGSAATTATSWAPLGVSRRMNVETPDLIFLMLSSPSTGCDGFQDERARSVRT